MSERYAMEDVRSACFGSYCSIQPARGKKERVSVGLDGRVEELDRQRADRISQRRKRTSWEGASIGISFIGHD
jgi:hypothetical protein